jgi:hypothetical protein
VVGSPTASPEIVAPQRRHAVGLGGSRRIDASFREPTGHPRGRRSVRDAKPQGANGPWRGGG